MPSPELQRFLDSMKIGYEQWHDGIGYDLDALRAMTPEERSQVETVLIRNLAGTGDWRDVEALAALDTPGATAVLKTAAKHRNAEVRNRALSILADEGPQTGLQLEDDIVRAVEQGALDLAEKHPTPRVKRALLDCARLAPATTRVHAAAMLMYLCGKADEPFDWNHRPFFLRFATEDNQQLRAAWMELREQTGV
ncbi:MAG TPA: hypothetical protein VKU01_28700 [Bryobacteraceae bacterium]|nr:hypothetical protein [Bryobacteraceae bacterium]